MKKLKRYLLVLISIILLSGCAKNNTTMKINKDKSMNLEVQILVIDESKNTLSANFDSAEIEKRGFKVITTTKDDYSGYKITKKFDNIDELSKGDNNVVDISKLLNSDFDFSKLFSKKTDFFKEVYTASFKYNINDYRLKYVTNETDGAEDDDEEDKTDIKDIMELTYTLVLPNKAKSNDASNVSDGGKNLVWKLSSNSDSKINYSFAFYNYKHIAILCGSALLVVIILIVLLVILKKKKESKGTLIYKEYDPSIESELNSNEIIKDSEPSEVAAPLQPKVEESSEPQNVVVEENMETLSEPQVTNEQINTQPQSVSEPTQTDTINQNNNYF